MKNGRPDFCSISHDVDLVIDKMRKKDYPKHCLDYYKKKAKK
jgi:hypothetical protein